MGLLSSILSALGWGKKPKQTQKDEIYGIDIDHSHARARVLAQEDFFWDCGDELAPFGSDEGDTALAEYRQWRKENPTEPLKDCLVWTIESVGEMDFSDYAESVLQKDLIQSQSDDSGFDDQQYIFTLDISVIATGFGQLVDEGKIDIESKPIIAIAIKRLKIWSEIKSEWNHASEFISNLTVLERILNEA